MKESRICDLGLRLEGSLYDRAAAQLSRELSSRGIDLEPKLYLSDGWGCPDRVPVIGVPFYLASSQAADLLRAAVDDVEDEEFIPMAMRHEAGHAFCYSHRLWEKPGWQSLFGRFDLPYPDAYHPTPFHPDFVRHLGGWYGQRHPDDDFAETFAVWLRDGDEAIRRHGGTRAGEKLHAMAGLASRFGRARPTVVDGALDAPIESMTQTLGDFIEDRTERFRARYPAQLEEALAPVFASGGPEPVAPFLAEARERLVARVAEATGEASYFVRRLVRRLERAARERGMKCDPARGLELHERLVALVTALEMHYAFTRAFV